MGWVGWGRGLGVRVRWVRYGRVRVRWVRLGIKGLNLI